MGIFAMTKQQQPPLPEQQKSRYERMALLLTMRTSQSPQPAPAALTQSSMGSVASSKAAAQAKSTSTSLNRNMPVASPAVIQRTRFVASSRKLGLGAYGAVLAGTDLCTGEQVAIKIIPDGRMKPANLEREVAVLRRLSDTRHPALCHFHAHIRPEEAKAGEIKVEEVKADYRGRELSQLDIEQKIVERILTAVGAGSGEEKDGEPSEILTQRTAEDL